MERLAFGDIVVDLAGREVLRAGRSVRLSPKAFQLLCVLVEKRPAAVSKQRLQDELWPGTYVVEKNITNLVAEIRAALGDEPARPRFIRTIHRFGYAFHEPQAAGVGDVPRSYSHNLPEHLSTFIGREREIAGILRRLHSAGLLTLTGTGGCGKTRLALAVARDLVRRFHDGVWMIDLAALSDPDLVPQSVASVLHVRRAPDKPLEDTLSDAVRDRQLLLLFDNCEHLIGACADLTARLIGAAPRLTILATSREALGVAGETIWPVAPLSVPDAAASESALESESVRLFVIRAAAVDPQFAITSANATTVASLCRSLDGVPLAIELAAAQLRTLTVEDIHARLSKRFQLLDAGDDSVPSRQRTLEAAIDWSYDLLDDADRVLMRRLAVFSGGWDLEAARHVCAGDPLAAEDVGDRLLRLVKKSLVVVESEHERYRFLESLRQYGSEKLASSGEMERLRDRHLDWFLELSRRLEPDLTTSRQIDALRLLRANHDNLRAALEWSEAAPQRRHATLELANHLFWFWLKHGNYAEGRQWLERALESSVSADPHQRAKTLMALGTMVFFLGDFSRARSLLAQSAELGDRSVAGFALGIAALAAMEQSDFAEGMRLASEGIAAARASSTPWVQAPAMALLAYAALGEGDFDRAAQLHEEALALCRAQGERWGMGISLFDLGLARLIQGRHDDARALAADGIVVAEEFDDRRGLGWALGLLSGIDAAEQNAMRAARLWGGMEALLQSVGASVQPTFQTWIVDRYFGAVRERIGASSFDRGIAEGRAMPVRKMLELAREAM